MARSLCLALALTGLFVTEAKAQTTFSVPNFVVDSIFFGDGTTALDFSPSGTLYVVEKVGRVFYLLPNGTGGFRSRQPLLDIRTAVDHTGESGLLGIAVDPEFSTNRYLYLFYTTSTDQRLVRYTLNTAGTSASSPTVILSGLPRSWPVHNGGDIQFRPGEPGNIYISLGDDTIPNEAPSTTSHRGKMLRVNKTNGQGLSSNPYYTSGSLATAQARLFSIGMRNPFRFTFYPVTNQPRSDVLYVSENGDSTDKVAWVRAGSNGGWSPTGDGPFINVTDPNHRVMYTGPASHIGIAIAASGPFADGNTPVLYLSNWINPAGGSILRFRLTGTDLDTASPVPADNGNPFARSRFATSLRFGPDGALYFTSSGADASGGGFYEVGRIRYVGGTPPQASFTTNPSPAQGPFPLTVGFTDRSNDTDGTIQRRDWDFGDGSTSSQTNPSHTYASPGNYTATLRVTDDDGLTDTAQADVRVVAPFTLTLRGEVLDGNDLAGGRRSGTTQLRFYQRDGTPILLPEGLGPDGNGAAVVDGDIDLVLPMNLTSGFVVVTAGEAEAILQTQTHAFSVPTGQSTHTETITLWPASTALRGRVTDTRMDPAVVDLGIARSDIASLYAVVAGRDYLPSAGFPTTGIAHRMVSDVLGNYYFPLREGGDYFLDVVADTGAATYLATLSQATVAAGDAVDLDLTLGLDAGGAGCDDLGAIAETPDVDYASQIQPLFGLCIGCHKPASANGGGLDLTEASSWGALVGAASTQVPGRVLVDPGNPETSYLMEKISCANPQVGNRMRPDTAMPVADQALVRDWIAQGALREVVMMPPDAGMPDEGTPDMGLDAGAAPDSDVLTDAMAPPDTGASTPDAGMAPPDAGTSEPAGTVSGGCRCAKTPLAGGSALGLPVGLGLVLGFGRLRNPRRRPR